MGGSRIQGGRGTDKLQVVLGFREAEARRSYGLF